MFTSIATFANFLFIAILTAISLYIMMTALNDMVGKKIRVAIYARRHKKLPPNVKDLQAKQDSIMAIIKQHNKKQNNAMAMYQIKRLNRKIEKMGIKDRSFEVK